MTLGFFSLYAKRYPLYAVFIDELRTKEGVQSVSLYLIIAIFIVGIWGLVAKDNLIKKIIGLNILNSGIVLFFVYIGSFQGTTAPIMEKGIKDVVDPIPQALMLAAIVIGICLTALALALVLKLYQKYKTLSISQIEKMSKDE